MVKLIQIFSVYITKELIETTTEQEQFWQIKDICYKLVMKKNAHSINNEKLSSIKILYQNTNVLIYIKHKTLIILLRKISL